MKINLKLEECRCTNVNLGAEGSQENPTSRTDINFEGLATEDAAVALVGSDAIKLLWNDEDQIEVLGITGIGSRAKLPEASVKFMGGEVTGATVHKFSFKPISGRMIEISCQVQVRHTAEQLVMFDKWQKKVGVLEIDVSKQGDLFEA